MKEIIKHYFAFIPKALLLLAGLLACPDFEAFPSVNIRTVAGVLKT